jgi:GH43 family beta-xylosidase
MRILKCYLFLVVFFLSACAARKGSAFTNPLLPSGADPWSVYENGFYYYTHTLGNRVDIWRTRSIARLGKGKRKTVFDPPPGLPYSKGLWAPEIHRIDGRWYIYVAADDGKNENHRLYVLENSARDPLKGEWEWKGRIGDSTQWAIDGSVFRHNGQLYLIWSGWEGNTNGQQDLYICRMKNPWTPETERVRISSPVYDWEKHGDLNDPSNPPHVSVNEGPQFLSRGEKLFIVYSASGCWTEQYALGLLSAHTGSNLLDSTSWKKHPEPVFTAAPENGVYAPGHNSFFTSPDGTENWILYHANSAAGQGCGKNRSPRAQRFLWKEDDTPDFGRPLKPGVPVPAPAAGKRK